MRIAFLVLVGLHGLIHLLGFVKAFELAPVKALELPIGRAAGVLWLVATLALLTTVALAAFRVPQWWWLALGAALLSQGLIVASWGDAKAGTIANVLLLLGALVAFAGARFEAEGERAWQGLVARAPRDARAEITEADLAALPPAAQRWLRRAGVLGRTMPRRVVVRQRGQMQTAPDAGFRDVVADQVFVPSVPAFLWRVRTTMFGLPVLGRDSFVDGHGRMHITLGGLVPVVDAADAKIDEGALLRYLGEMVWLPAAALDPRLRWTAGDDPERTARLAMRLGDLSVEAELDFDEEGRFVTLRADRYFGGGAEAERRPWRVRASAWRRFDGVEIPSEGDVVWALPEGDFVFYRWVIDDVDVE